jgi:type 1 glutamine amidotransferase
MSAAPLVAYLVCDSPERNHDCDFARVRLAEALYAAGGIWTDVGMSYADTARLDAADLLVTYTAGLQVTDAECQALRRFLERGGRWFALHGTNAGVRSNEFADIVGSRFMAHPPYGRFAVSIRTPSDPLLAGLETFQVEDELYLIEPTRDVEVLLETRWGGKVREQAFDDLARPLMYRLRAGKGGVIYLGLGHANRTFEKASPTVPDPPDRRGPWDSPVYRELIRRGVAWAAGRLPFE